ncbi:ABC transporter permease [Actinocorallia longicatena]|uniref:ABC transporter permease n=1 Tax=Actinocorallia longicatena TaxID=111803 RepID=A0ABP6QFW5_9ACTN
MLNVIRLDYLLLWRNRMAVFSVVGVPLFFAVSLTVGDQGGVTTAGLPVPLYAATGDIGFFLLAAVLFNLASALTARREERTLRRLRTSALSDREILGASMLGAGLLYTVQAGAIMVVIVAGLDGGAPRDVPLLLTGMALGVVVFSLLALALSGLTPNAEAIQWTAAPILLVSIAASGFLFPLDGLPEAVRQTAGAMPLTPVVEITRTAWLGRDYTTGGGRDALGSAGAWAACAIPLLTLLAWTGLGALMARRWFRWEPRRDG